MKQAILNSILYRDIFDYPIKIEEIQKFLVKKRGNLKEIKKKLSLLLEKKKVEESNGFYFLPGRKKIIEVRLKREKYSQKKLELAQRVANLLKFIPWVSLVGVSGAVATYNAEKEDEIDFFIITAKKRLWLARFLVTTLLSLIGRRKFPEEKNFTDKICLNYFISEENLEINPKNLHTAFDLFLLKPLWSRKNSYQKLLEKNRWALQFLPNAWPLSEKNFKNERKEKKKKVRFLKSNVFLDFLEKILKNLQKKFMKKPLGNEKITPTALKFLAHDHNKAIMKEYKLRIKKHK